MTLIDICLDIGRERTRTTIFALPLALAVVLSTTISLANSSGSAPFVPAKNATTQEILDKVSHLSASFIENRGQVTEGVRYYSMGSPSVAFRDDGVMFVAGEGPVEGLTASEGRKEFKAHSIPAAEPGRVAKSVAYLMRFEDANTVRPTGLGQLEFRSNFFLGGDPSRWTTDVPSFRGVVYDNLYDGVDLVFSSDAHGVKYEFVVEPGVDPAAIKMSYEGIEALGMDTDGLVVGTAIGEIRDSPPYSFQGGGEKVTCGFASRGSASFGFDCEGWDRSRPLHIDPLIYSTFLGGMGWDRGYSIKVDGSGSAYVTGHTFSPDFPVVPGSYDTALAGTDDAFVAKLNPTGSALVYSTFLGGSGSDVGLSIALDSGGSAHVAGETLSSDFPTSPGAFDCTFNGKADAFVTKLDAAGSAIVFSTFIGGTENDTWPTVAVGPSDDIYVTGITASTDFPVTPGAFDISYNAGGSDAFAAKLNSAGTTFVYSTFLGGSDTDFAYSIAVDSIGSAYVTGGAWSVDFPTTPGALNRFQGGSSDVFVTKVNATGATLDYSTFIGGSVYDTGLSLVIDSTGVAHVTGATISPDFPTTPGAYDNTLNSLLFYDAFLLRLNASGSTLLYSTYFGGSREEYGNAIEIDRGGNAYITGGTDSSDLPVTPGAFDTTYNGLADAYVTMFDASGIPANSTYLGGSGTDWLYPFLAIDDLPAAYVTGLTDSFDFPITPGAFDTTINPNRDGFVTKLGPLTPDLAIDSGDIVFIPGGPVATDTIVFVSAAVHNFGTGDAANVVVRFYDGLPSGSNQIGLDQLILFIQNLSGKGVASVIWLAGPSGMHDICVAVDPDDSINESNETNNTACGRIGVTASYTLSLSPGHRLISFPLSPVNDDIASVLSSISGCYDYVRWYDISDATDHWKPYAPGRGYNDLTRLDNTMGFWINVTTACDLVVVGFTANMTAMSLHQGWNMVGFPSFNASYTVGDLKAGLGLAGVIVEAFDQRAAPYYLQRASDTYVMKAGEGYWIYAPSDTTWIVFG